MNSYLKYKELQKNNLILSYSGSLNMELIAQFMKLAEAYLVIHGMPIKQKRAIVNIFIETLQNIYYHGLTNEGGANTNYDSLLLFTRDGDQYTIFTGNYLKKDAIPVLKERFEELQSMSIEDLGRFYLDSLEKVQISKRGRAGLGLIKILIDSRKQTSYSFETVNSEVSFFTLEVKVSR